MKKLILILLTANAFSVNAQYLMTSDSLFSAEKPMTGRIWGSVFGDYFYKAHSDSLARGASNQYTSVQTGDNAFAVRRIYLGYDFNISEEFATEILLAAEDWNQEQKLGFFVKYANIRWKNVWKGADLIIGQSVTPGFSETSQTFWGYRSIERTIADMRRTQSYDFGIAIQGKWDKDGNYGYHFMVGNGTKAMAENDRFKKFYGNVFAYLLDKKFMIDLYADYERIHWEPGFHHSQNMVKLFVGYTIKPLTIGLEGFLNHRQQDVEGYNGNMKDTLNANAAGLSVFVRGAIMEKKLNFFLRMDVFTPYLNYTSDYQLYQGFSKNYEPNTREKFITVGLDYTPIKHVHFMPNIWLNTYHSQDESLAGRAYGDYDLVYRMTFYYVFGR